MDVEAYFLASRRLTTPPPPTPASRRPRRPGWRSWRPPLWPGPLWGTLPVLLGQAHALQSLLLPRLLLLDVALVASDVLGWPAPAAADLWPCPLTPSLPRSHRTSRRGFRPPHWSSLVVLLRPLAINIYYLLLRSTISHMARGPGVVPTKPHTNVTALHCVDFGTKLYSLFVSLGECELGTSERDRVSLNRRI